MARPHIPDPSTDARADEPDQAAGEAWQPDGEDVPLDERITILTRMLAAPRPRDPAGLRGLLGTTWLQVYERDGHESALRTGLAQLHDAFVAEPEHEDRLIWWYWLGAGHRELAQLSGSREEFDSAIDWLGRLLDGLPEKHPDRVALTPQWMELCTDRFELIASDAAAEPLALTRAAEWLTSQLESACPASGPYGSMLIGLARLQRYDLTGRPADLDAGIARLSDVLDRLPPGTPRLDLARFELADALRTRWQLGGAPSDLDAAIDRWQGLAADHTDGWIRASCGSLLLERASRTASRADATASIVLLRQATADDGRCPAGGPGRDDDAWLGWYDLGRAYQTRWRIGAAPEDLADAQRCLDRALDLGAVGDELLPLVHVDRLRFALDGLAHGNGGSPDAARLSMLLAEGGRVLDGDPGLAPGDHALLAGLLAYTEVWACGHDVASIDAGRIRARVAPARQFPDADDGWHAMLDVLEGIADLARTATAGGANRPGAVSVRHLLPTVLRASPDRNGADHGGTDRDGPARPKANRGP